VKESRFSETQVVSPLSKTDAGITAQESCRKHGISLGTYCKWKSKHGGLDASDL
jgi:putative transposase